MQRRLEDPVELSVIRRSALLLALCALPLLTIAKVPPPQDTDYAPGTIVLDVDASDVARRIMRIEQTIPVQAGPLTLLYPEWLPGNHAPRGPVDKIAGLRITGNGQPIKWKRDPADVYAFHIEVPQGVNSITTTYQ